MGLLVGLAVLAISAHSSWRGYSSSIVRYPQYGTSRDIAEIQKAIDAYQREKNSLPDTLTGLAPVGEGDWRMNETGAAVDGWWRPFHYWTDGTRYRIISYGRDGKPGGVGLDRDISSDNLRPKDTAPTFKQFFTDPRARRMLVVCAMSGLIGFILGFRSVTFSISMRRGFLTTLIRLFITIAATSILAIMISAAHVPSGH